MAICRWLELDTGVCIGPDIYSRLEPYLILNQNEVHSGLNLCQACIAYSTLAQIEKAQTGELDLRDGTGPRVCVGYKSI